MSFWFMKEIGLKNTKKKVCKLDDGDYKLNLNLE